MANNYYNYFEAVKNDINYFIESNVNIEDYNNFEEFHECVYYDIIDDDSVTGNMSGSYTFNRYEAQQYVLGNLDLLYEVIAEYGYTAEQVGERFLNEDWELFDVTIRCYVVDCVLYDVLEEIWSDHEKG